MASPTPDRSPPDLWKFLGECWPFSALPQYLVFQLSQAVSVRTFAEGELLMKQGDHGECLMILRSGSAQILRTDADGRAHLLDTVQAGDLVGEMALFTGDMRAADVLATSTVEAAIVTKAALAQLAHASHPVAACLSEVLANRIGSHNFDALVSKQLNKYRIVRTLGRGGMGVVYEAEVKDSEGTGLFALKMLSHGLSLDQRSIKRFRDEGRLALEHDNIIRVHDIFSGFGTQFIVMELCQGTDLQKVILDSRDTDTLLPSSEVRAILGQLAAALAHTHAQGIVHRDVKPSNVLLGLDGTIKLSDFGIATLEDHAGITDRRMGTERYMAPELFQHAVATNKVDLFSFGLLAFELLWDPRRFPNSRRPEASAATRGWAVPSADSIRCELDPELYQLIQDSVAEHPDDRRLDLSRVARWSRPVDTELLGLFLS